MKNSQGVNNNNQTSTINHSQQQKKRKKKKENLANSGLFCFGWSQDKTVGSEKRDKYIDIAWELKKLWKMKLTVITIVTGALSPVTIGLIKGLED